MAKNKKIYPNEKYLRQKKLNKLLYFCSIIWVILTVGCLFIGGIFQEYNHIVGIVAIAIGVLTLALLITFLILMHLGWEALPRVFEQEAFWNNPYYREKFKDDIDHSKTTFYIIFAILALFTVVCLIAGIIKLFAI